MIINQEQYSKRQSRRRRSRRPVKGRKTKKQLRKDARLEIEEVYLTRYDVSLDVPLARAWRQIEAGRGDDLMQEVDMMSCPKAEVTANSFVSYYSRPNKFRQFDVYLPRNPVPTLVVAGSVDERQPDIPKKIAPFIDGKRLHLAVIEGAGHFFRDFNIDEAMEAAIEFTEE